MHSQSLAGWVWALSGPQDLSALIEVVEASAPDVGEHAVGLMDRSMRRLFPYPRIARSGDSPLLVAMTYFLLSYEPSHTQRYLIERNKRTTGMLDT